MSIQIGRLTDEISSQLRKYSQIVSDDLDQIIDDVTAEAVEKIKDNVRKAKLIQTGSYLKGWTRKKVGKSIYIHNKTDYQLTHLLEHGHAMANGGRAAGIAHIRPVEEWAEKEFEERVEKVIKS